ncbi:hypothetical protein ACP70R_024731 [Stipagrostis hirtigluma subsp. patula]
MAVCPHRVEGQPADEPIAKRKRAAATNSTDMSARLPEDVLAGVLRRLAPRFLAASRCVSKAWRAIIDGHRLLRAELLPRSLAGFFVKFQGLRLTEFFSRPSTDDSISGKHDYLPASYNVDSWSSVQDHCNGLLLLATHVLNPATRWCAPLPPRPRPRMGETFDYRSHLVYDPTISSHYEVFLIPQFHHNFDHDALPYRSYRAEFEYDPVVEQSEWPPSTFVLNVFSSKTGRWEERTLVREGEAAGTIADMRLNYWSEDQRRAVYWRGVLYVHCQTEFVMRISVSDNSFQVIKAPIIIEEGQNLHLGKSEKGVYCALAYERCKVKVWFLDESCCQIKWTLKHDADLVGRALHKIEPVVTYQNCQRQVRGPWILQDINHHYYSKYCYNEDDNDIQVAAHEENYEWDSKDEKLEWNSDSEDREERNYYGNIDILGFHPYKEIIFLGESFERGLAYHWNSSKVQYLGHLRPTEYDDLPNELGIQESFPYTPCWIRELATEQNNSGGHDRS